MFRLNNLRKNIAVFLLVLLLAEIIAAPIQVYAQAQKEQSSSGSTAIFATLGALAAGVAAYCIAQAVGEVKIFGFGIGKVFQCSITNPPGVHLLSSDGLKKWIFDPAARIVIRALLQATTQQIVSWIQSDGGKNVGYVANLEQALRREADAAGGEFLNNLTGLNLCGNIGAFLNISLRTPGLRQRLECTVTDIIRNLDSFYGNFQQGGWPAFIRITLEPQNRAAGAYLFALDAKIEAENRASQRVQEGYRVGGAFEGFKVPVQKCEISTIEEYPEEAVIEQEKGEILPEVEEKPSVIPGRGRQNICRTEYETKTPGQLIAAGLSKATFGGLDFAINAKEFDEAISVIISALINKLITTAFVGSSESTSGQGIFDPGFRNLPREDLTESVIASRINDGLFMADAAIVLADAKLISDRRALFDARKKIDELTAQNPSDAPDDIKDQIQQLRQQISALQSSIAATFEVKKKILFSQYDLLFLKQSLAASASPSEIIRVAQDLPVMLLRLGDVTSQLGVLPAAAISAGSNKRDFQEILRGTKNNLTNALTLVDDTGREIERVLTGNLENAKRQGLTVSRTALLTQRTILRNQLDLVVVLESDVAKTDNNDRIKDMARAFIKQLFIINQLLEQTSDILTKIDTSLKL